jgi:hypothetical protein
MKQTTYWKKIRLNALINIILLNAWVALVPQPTGATEPQQPAATSPAISGSAPQKDPGMKIFVDPKTGEISKPAPQPVLPEAAQRSFEAVKEPLPELLEMPSPRPGGGVMIDLQGQFRSPLKATRDADGKLSIKHQSETSGSREKK